MEEKNKSGNPSDFLKRMQDSLLSGKKDDGVVDMIKALNNPSSVDPSELDEEMLKQLAHTGMEEEDLTDEAIHKQIVDHDNSMEKIKQEDDLYKGVSEILNLENEINNLNDAHMIETRSLENEYEFQLEKLKKDYDFSVTAANDKYTKALNDELETLESLKKRFEFNNEKDFDEFMEEKMPDFDHGKVEDDE